MSYDDRQDYKEKRVGDLELSAYAGIRMMDEDDEERETSRDYNLELIKWKPNGDGETIWQKEYYSEEELLKGFKDNLYRLGEKEKKNNDDNYTPKRIYKVGDKFTVDNKIFTLTKKGNDGLWSGIVSNGKKKYGVYITPEELDFAWKPYKKMRHKDKVLEFLMRYPNSTAKEIREGTRILSASFNPVLYSLLNEEGRIARVKKGRSYRYYLTGKKPVAKEVKQVTPKNWVIVFDGDVKVGVTTTETNRNKIMMMARKKLSDANRYNFEMRQKSGGRIINAYEVRK